MRLALFLTVIAWSGLVLSSEGVRTMVCPAFSARATEVLSSIQGLRDELNKNLPACTPIDQKLKNVSDIVTNEKWGEVRDILKGRDDVSLEGDDIVALNGLVETASRNLAETVSLISGGAANCIDHEQKTPFLSKLSGVVREVSTIAGQVMGPYGMAVNLGGQFLSSALSGISQMLPSRAYNFKDPATEDLFMNQFCSFADIHMDVGDYLGLPTRQEELDVLSGYLDEKLKSIEDNCPQCLAYSLAWQAKQETDKIMNRILADLAIVETGNDRDNGHYSRCTEMHRALHTGESDFSQFIAALQSYENPMISRSDADLIKEVVATAQELQSVYPGLRQCVKLEPQQKVALSRDFNNLMRDEIIPLNEEIFGQQMAGFRFLADKLYWNPMGEYIENTLNRRKWVKDERTRVFRELSDPNFWTSAQKIRDEQKSLQARFMTSLFPRFIKFMENRIEKSLREFRYGVRGLVRIQQRRGNLDTRTALSEEARVYGILELSIDRTHTLNRYCEFSKYLLVSSFELDEVCRDAEEDVRKSFDRAKEASKRAAVRIAQKTEWMWQKSGEVYQTSRVSDYANRIGEWNARGPAKFCLRSNPVCREFDNFD